MGYNSAVPDTPPQNIDRYSRQVLFPPIDEDGQRRIMRGRVALIGCGALGSVIANTLVRAGAGYVRICDRDFIEPNNLQRQMLFDERDIALNLPKAIAAVDKLRLINSQVELEPVVTDVTHHNIADLVRGADVILDGTDNFETRYLINDVSVKTKTPWIYGGVLGASGLVMPVLPGEGPCLRCVFESAPPPEISPTCDTAGVIAPAVNVVASFQATEAIKLLAGKREELNRSLTTIDVWTGRITSVNVDKAGSDTPCPCCRHLEFEYLEGKAASATTILCGGQAVQISPAPQRRRKVDFAAIAGRIAPVATGEVEHNRFMLTAEIGDYTICLFSDGRAIIKGTTDPDQARAVYARYVGD